MAETLHPATDTSGSVDALFASWSPALFRYALRLCRIPDLAEDLVQEAFLALCRKRAEGHAVRNPKLWTLCVVRQQASKHRRDLKRHGEHLQPHEVLESMAAQSAFPSFTPDRGADVAPLLSILTPREREVFLLRMESLKYQQIASQLGVSPKTVAALLGRAFRKMHKAIDGGLDHTKGLPRLAPAPPGLDWSLGTHD
jgi:RNA polymerase sigma-70 factor (ECF subfamily)